MSENKHLQLFDFQKSKDTASIGHQKGYRDTEVIFRNIDTKEPILTLHNKVVIAGSQTVAMKCFDLPELVALPTYNQDLSLDESVAHGTTPANTPKVCLFCCGTQGCGQENSQVKPVDYTKRIQPDDDIVPFRYQLLANDLTDEERLKYFGRKTTTNRYAYYFKAFESDPVLYMRYTDGTVIDANLYDSSNETPAETFVEMNFVITKEDYRDYFRATTGINDARINSISLCTAWYTTSGGYTWYQDITPFTQLNIPNEPLIDLTKGIDVLYHVYF